MRLTASQYQAWMKIQLAAQNVAPYINPNAMPHGLLGAFGVPPLPTLQQHMQMLAAYRQMTVAGAFGRFPSPTVRKPVENGGIVLGEVEAFRAWRVYGGLLASLTAERIWLPGEPMDGAGVDTDNCKGVYAFKTAIQALEYAHQFAGQFAIGRVKMWGTIIEHETGYRAAFARPIEILLCHWRKMDGELGTLAELSKRYGLAVPKAGRYNTSHTQLQGVCSGRAV